MKLDQAFKVIMNLEGFSSKPYMDAAGIWTIGYGTTFLNGQYVTSETPTITEEQAEAAVKLHATVLAASIAPLLTRMPTVGQMNALVIFTYNIGLGNFKKSTLLKMFNAGADDTAIRLQLLRWTKATDPKTGRKVELAGLTRRREIEYRMYIQKGDESEAAATTA